jgi:hypothetical protein
VRNNLAAVIGILEVERERAHPRTADEALAACASWLKAIARAHDLLAAGSFAPMDLRHFIAVVAGGIMTQAGAGAPQIEIVYDQVSLKLPPKPVLALACITNELILNAIKHAFHGRAHGRIGSGPGMRGIGTSSRSATTGSAFPRGRKLWGPAWRSSPPVRHRPARRLPLPARQRHHRPYRLPRRSPRRSEP